MHHAGFIAQLKAYTFRTVLNILYLLCYLFTLVFALQTFTGNRDMETVNKHELDRPFEARYVRVYPKTWHTHVSLRWEVYGCPIKGNLIQNFRIFTVLNFMALIHYTKISTSNILWRL